MVMKLFPSFFAILLAAVQTAMACPGGHIRELHDNYGRPVIQIDLRTNIVWPLEQISPLKAARIKRAFYQPERGDVVPVGCAYDDECNRDVGAFRLPVKLIEEQGAVKLTVEFDGLVYRYIVRDFDIKRGCQPPEPPLSWGY